MSIPPKKISKWKRRPKGSSNFGNVRVHLLVDASMIIMYIHMGAPKSFQLYMGIYIVLLSSTKSMTFISTDVGSQIKWNLGPKGSSNFGSVRVYLLVDVSVTIMYIHMKALRVSNTT